MLFKEDEPRRPPIGHWQAVEHVEDAGEGVAGEAFDGHARNELVAQLRRVARPQFGIAQPRIQIHRAIGDAQRDRLIGQHVVQVIAQLITLVGLVALAYRDGAHAAHVHQIAEAVLQVIELFLEVQQQPVGRVAVVYAVIVVDQFAQLGIPPRRRQVLQD